MAAKEDVAAETIMLLLFSLSRNVLRSELPLLEHRHVGAESAISEGPSIPSPCSSSSLQDAYGEAWDETDSLSDWDANEHDVQFQTPQTPELVAEWLHDPALLHTGSRRKLEHELSDLKASNLHRRFESTTMPLPSEVAVPKHVLQAPEVPLPRFKSPVDHFAQLQKNDLVHAVLSRSGLLAQVSRQQLCFTTSSVALQCLEVLLVRCCMLQPDWSHGTHSRSHLNPVTTYRFSCPWASRRATAPLHCQGNRAHR